MAAFVSKLVLCRDKDDVEFLTALCAVASGPVASKQVGYGYVRHTLGSMCVCMWPVMYCMCTLWRYRCIWFISMAYVQLRMHV